MTTTAGRLFHVPFLIQVVVLSLFFSGRADCEELNLPANDLSSIDPNPPSSEEIMVTGKRASLANAQQFKRESDEIVDSVMAEEINKLPDRSLAEAMQRITGVQIARDRGEGSALQGHYFTNNALNIGITLRGLPMVETTLNGREVFTAGTGRTFNFADIPAEMISAVHVYKTASASQIEGGVGGMVDLRTRRPFEFSGRELVLKAGGMHGNLSEENDPQFSLLASDRWETGVGEFGALINLAYQKRSYEEHYKTAGRTEIGGISLPSSSTQVANTGERERIGVDLVLEWRPTDHLELYAEAHHGRFKTLEDATQLQVTGPAGPGNISLFPGTSDASAVTWATAGVSTIGQARDTLDRNTQLAIGGNWIKDAWTLKADLSRTRSYNELRYSALFLTGATASNFTHNVGSTLADTSLTANLLDLSSFTSAQAWYSFVPFHGDMTALQFDGEYRPDWPVIRNLSGGVRYAKRDASNSGAKSLFVPVALANAENVLIANPNTDYLPTAANVDDFLVGDPGLARHVSSFRKLLGVNASPVINPLNLWKIEEKVGSGYLMSAFDFPVMRLQGNAGIRINRTHSETNGTAGERDGGGNYVPNTGIPIRENESYTDVLPSFNLRLEALPGLYLRGAASKTMTRPDFNHLSPSLSVNIPQLKGSTGNPDLAPIRSENFDIAVEKYFSKTTSVALTVFRKNVDGFISSVEAPETFGGVTYLITRPYNTGASVIRGGEIGYQQFFDFLPGWLGGLGLQANYTYVDSDVEQSHLPLAGLSRHSANIIGIYERGPFSARIAYNWRDDYMTSVSSGIPVYMKGYGWLDASFQYRFSDRVSLSIEGANLSGTVRNTYYGVETRPQTSFIADTYVTGIVTVRF